MEKINLVEILKDCPKGMELDCLLCNSPIALVDVAVNESTYPIIVVCKDGCIHVLTKYGEIYNHDDAKCVIFPKGKTTWEGFVPPCKFKDGDIISSSLSTCIFKGEGKIKGTVDFYCGISDVYFHVKDEKLNPDGHYGDIVDYRLATEEEKERLFQAIKDNGYKWNAETKTLEKLPKFKVGENTDKALAPDFKGEDYSGKRFGYKIPNGYEFDCIQNNEIILKPINTTIPKDL